MLPLLACLMLVLTAWTGMAHAAELRGVETRDVTVHVAGDGDEVPADADKAYPHHHASCHEHHVNIAALGDVAPVPPHVRSVVLATIGKRLTGRLPDPVLRPPRA
jgi:hypothetical protein